MPLLIRIFLLCWTLWFYTFRSEGYIRVSGSDSSATVSPSAKLAVLHSLSPIWNAMTVNPSTGAFYGSWSVPDTFNGGNAGLISARLHGAVPPASPTGTPATAETTINVVVPPKIEPIGFTATGSCSGDAYWNYYWLGPERLSSMLRKQGTFSEPDVLYESVGFTYDADSRRTYKTHTVRYTTPGKPDKVEYSKVLWCGWLPIMERRSSNGGATWTRRWFQWGVDLSGSLAGAGGINGLVAIIEETDGGTPIRTLLPVTDGLGNITAVINAANGATVATYAYGPFGEPLSETGEVDACPFRWQTKWYDAESQHYYFGYRYYSPRLGRWLSRDPLREAGGFNLYTYCGNDPVNRHDPLGLKSMWIGDDGEAHTTADILERENERQREECRENFENPDSWKIVYIPVVLAAVPLASTAVAEGGVASTLAFSAQRLAAWWLTGGEAATAMWSTRAALVVGGSIAANDISEGVPPLESLGDGMGAFATITSFTGIGNPNLRIPRFGHLRHRRIGLSPEWELLPPESLKIPQFVISDPKLLRATGATTSTLDEVSTLTGSGRIRGAAFANHLAEAFGGNREVFAPTKIGRRFQDVGNLTFGTTDITIEGKNYFRTVRLTEVMRKQVIKDVLWMRQGRFAGRHRVAQWHFANGGPDDEFRAFLTRWRINIVERR